MGRERERVKMAFSMKTRNDKVDETDSMQIILPFFTIFHSFPFLLQQLFFCFLIKMSIFIIIIFL